MKFNELHHSPKERINTNCPSGHPNKLPSWGISDSNYLVLLPRSLETLSVSSQSRADCNQKKNEAHSGNTKRIHLIMAGSSFFCSLSPFTITLGPFSSLYIERKELIWVFFSDEGIQNIFLYYCTAPGRPQWTK